MKRFSSCVPLLAMCAILLTGPEVYAAAQLKAGAKTSAAPTSTIPAERAIQITFDPDITPDTAAPTDTGYDVDAFQLSVGYDSSLMTVASVDLVSPFQPSAPEIEATPADATPGTPAVGYVDDPTTGTISYISGETPDPTSAGPGDVNIFSVTFILNPGVSFDQMLDFSIFGSDANGDFIQGYDPTTGQYLTTYGSDITPTYLDLTYNQATQQTGSGGLGGTGGSSTPLPAGAIAGLFAMACCGWMIRHRVIA